MPHFDRILVPLDLSRSAQPLLEYVAFTGSLLGASVDLLHVGDSPSTRWLARWVIQLQRSGLRVRSRIEHGDPCAAILRVAHDDNYDLIVMGTRGGDLAERVVRLASCPVVTIPLQDADLSVGQAEQGALQ